MKPYLDLARDILENGTEKTNRTGVNTLSIFGAQTRYDLADGFPLVTTKKVMFKSVVAELLWFLKGATNINDGLVEHTKIWNPWAAEDGELGPIYGYQWRKWRRYGTYAMTGDPYVEHIDQVRDAINMIRTQPDSRRIIISAWNVADLRDMALPPCHLLMQFNVTDDRLDLQLYQRSADLPVGVPFNIASYALLLTMMAQECNLVPGHFVHTFGDVHIYMDQVDKMRLQLEREPYPLPQVKIAEKNIFDLGVEDVELVNYQHHPFIKFPVAV